MLRDVSEMVKPGSHTGTRWLNMYGPSQPKTTIPLPIGGMPRTVDGSITGMTWKDYYMRHPDAAPMFRGRLLVSERMEMHAPKKYKLRAKDHQVHSSPCLCMPPIPKPGMLTGYSNMVVRTVDLEGGSN